MNIGLNSVADDYAIVFDFPMTIQLNGILPIINNSPNPVNITLGNPGTTPTVTIDGNSGAYGGFFIAMGNVTLQNMVFQNLTAKGGYSGDGISGQDAGDRLTLGTQVAFVDDTSFGAGGANVFIKGNGTIVYNGTTDYQGTVVVNNANLKVNGQITQAPVFVCRNAGFSSQRGTLSGIGALTGDVFANSGTIAPDTGGTFILGRMTLNSADPGSGALGSLVRIKINSSGTPLVAVAGPASLVGILEINLDPNAKPGKYTVLTSSGITGTFDSVKVNSTTFRDTTPRYKLSYLPAGAPTTHTIKILCYAYFYISTLILVLNSF